MAKWTLTSIVGVIVLLTIGGFTLYNSDFKYILASMPEKDIFILEYDLGNKVEIMTRSSVCPYALFRVTKDEFSAKCGWRKLLDARWYLEYYKTYGDDEWVRLQRKPTQIELEVSKTEEGYLIKKTTPYYATKSRSGTGGILTETYIVTKDRVKSSLEFDTDYTNRQWRAIWKTIPNIEVVDDKLDMITLEKQLNVFYDDVLFDYRIDNDAFYKVQKGDFEIDPLILFGNLTSPNASAGTMGTFKYGYCEECDNLGNISFSSDSSAFTATYYSGWEISDVLRQPDNLTFGCTDVAGGAGYCKISMRTGSQIITPNGTQTITRCLFNQSNTCSNEKKLGGTNFSFVPGALNNFDGLLMNDSDIAFLGINMTPDLVNSSFANARSSNYTINISRGSIEMLVSLE